MLAFESQSHLPPLAEGRVNDLQNEVRRVLDALRTAIRLSGVSHRRIERELALSTGYLTRILAGQVQLRIAHVLSILQVVGLAPGNFFAALYPASTPAGEIEARLTRMLAAAFARGE